MCTETYVVLMTSPADTEEMYQRLKQALGELDYETEKTHTESGGIVCGLDRSQPVVLPVPRVNDGLRRMPWSSPWKH